MVAENEWSYNGLLFGYGSPIKVVNVDGLYDADIRSSSQPKSVDHGSYISARFFDEKKIVISGHVHSEEQANFSSEVAALRRAFVPVDAILPLTFKLPGETERLVYCLPQKRRMPQDTDFIQNKLAKWTVELLAGDPRVYSTVEKLLAGAGIASNEGDFSTLPIITISGPSTNPLITNTTTGESIQVMKTLIAGQVLVLDFPAKTVKLDGVSVYDSLGSGFSWFPLRPGDNAITVSGGGTFETRWRDAWV